MTKDIVDPFDFGMGHDIFDDLVHEVLIGGFTNKRIHRFFHHLDAGIGNKERNREAHIAIKEIPAHRDGEDSRR
jgi:hypothetical protein